MARKSDVQPYLCIKKRILDKAKHALFIYIINGCEEFGESTYEGFLNNLLAICILNTIYICP
jgi:hypothetical protein